MSHDLKIAMQLAVDAGDVLKKYHHKKLAVAYKKDQFDPLTLADKESDDLLRAGIAKAFPKDEILSEENPLLPRAYNGRVWMVDPLDDTKGFIAGRDTPGVMIGLLVAGQPTLGVVYLPFRDEWYFAERGNGAFKKARGKTVKIHANHAKDIDDSVLVTRIPTPGDTRPMEAAVDQLPFKGLVREGCTGAKIGLIAAGQADALIHTHLKAGKWDTLAAQVILVEAGGAISDIDGKPLDYTKSKSSLDRYFIAAATPELLKRLVAKMAKINAELHIF